MAKISGVSGRTTSLSYQYDYHSEAWFGKVSPQTSTRWADRATLNPFVVISGDNDWGAGEQLFGVDDISTAYDYGTFDMFLPVANTSDTTSRMRIVWGTGTMAEAVTAGQYTELMYHKLAANAVYTPRKIASPLLRIYNNGTKMQFWAQHWNATNLATISFFLGVFSIT